MPTVQLGTKAVGSMLKMNVGGSPRNFRLTHQGLPSSMYDASCDGTWVLLEDIYENRQWDSSNNDYKNSDVQAWLNNASNGFLSLLDADIREAIKQVKIPYVNGTGGAGVASGANGLSCKVFLYGGYELGWTTSDNGYFPVDGAKLDYFQQGTGSAANQKRIAKLNGSPAYWWTRSPNMDGSSNVWNVNSDGDCYNWNYGNAYGVRPGFILPSSLLVSDDGTVLTNEPPTAPGSIDVQGVVGGGNATITLTAASDTDGTVESYRYERQVDGGGWTQFADTSSLTQTDAVSSEWGTVAYRACAVDDAGEAGPYATSETYDVNSGWVVISGPNEDMGDKPAPFLFQFSASCTGPSAATTGISVKAALDGKQLYSGTVDAGQVVSVVIDTRGLAAGEHTVEAQASKDEYLSAAKSYTFDVPALTLPNNAVIDWMQNPDGQTICPPTLGRAVICRNGKDADAELDALEARIAALEGAQS